MQSYNALMFKEMKEAVASLSWKSRGSGLGRLQIMEYWICGPTEWQEYDKGIEGTRTGEI